MSAGPDTEFVNAIHGDIEEVLSQWMGDEWSDPRKRLIVLALTAATMISNSVNRDALSREEWPVAWNIVIEIMDRIDWLTGIVGSPSNLGTSARGLVDPRVK